MPCPIRTSFQRDRDRIIHCNAFRRLKHKTQVFITPEDDHFVTRLTHTLEVAQIARTIARALNLNEDLTEAISLGHDLGHTPFGHIGEDVLNQLVPQGFRHNEQSLRVVDVLENSGDGLNLSWEVRDGIVSHSKSSTSMLAEWPTLSSIEAEVVRISDVVAYVNHDLDDALRAGAIALRDVPGHIIEALGDTRSQRINTMVSDVLVTSWNVRSGKAATNPLINMSSDMRATAEDLRRFLFRNVYEVQAERQNAIDARAAISKLYKYLCDLPESRITWGISADLPQRRAIDHIAGMTDQFALRLAAQI